jgi:putative FmdB family regulatory protein
MPLYEYECTACHKRTEKIQKFSDPEITTCPHCGGHIERVVSAPAISFKGGGWYADGYGNAKPKSSGDSTTSDSSAKPASDSAPSTPAAAPAATAPAPTPAAASSSDKK